MKIYLFIVLCFATCLLSCQPLAEIDQDKILAYIQANNLTTEVTPEGIHYIIDKVGPGNHPTAASTMTIHYEGFLLDGTKFDSSVDRGAPSDFALSSMILGWQLGIPLFREGGKGTLIIPSELGYGNNPPASSSIPKKSVLLFTVDLIDVR